MIRVLFFLTVAAWSVAAGGCASFYYEAPLEGPTATLTITGSGLYVNRANLKSIDSECSQAGHSGNVLARTTTIHANKPLIIHPGGGPRPGFGILGDMIAFFPLAGSQYELEVNTLQGWFYMPRGHGFTCFDSGECEYLYAVQTGGVGEIYEIVDGRRQPVPYVRTLDRTPEVLYRGINVDADNLFSITTWGKPADVSFYHPDTFESAILSFVQQHPDFEVVLVGGERVPNIQDWVCENMDQMRQTAEAAAEPLNK